MKSTLVLPGVEATDDGQGYYAVVTSASKVEFKSPTSFMAILSKDVC